MSGQRLVVVDRDRDALHADYTGDLCTRGESSRDLLSKFLHAAYGSRPQALSTEQVGCSWNEAMGSSLTSRSQLFGSMPMWNSVVGLRATTRMHAVSAFGAKPSPQIPQMPAPPAHAVS